MRSEDERAAFIELLNGKERKNDLSGIYNLIAFATMVEPVADESLMELRNRYVDKLVEVQNPVGLITKAADILANDDYTTCDAHTAFNYYLLATLNGDWFGIECLADMFFTGKGVEQNYQVAYYLLHFIFTYAPEPNQLSYYEMGKIMKEGYLFGKDEIIARFCFNKAIEVVGEYAFRDDYAQMAKSELEDM